MFKVVLLLLLAAVFVEFYVLVAVAKQISVLPTLLLAFGSAILGLRVLIKQVRGYLSTAQSQLQQANGVNELLSQAILMFICALCLILPGLISDLVGLLLLIPFVRKVLISAVVVPYIDLSKIKPQQFGSGNVFEGEYSQSEVKKQAESLQDQKKR